MTRARDEAGWTLTELLLAMTLMLVVMSATLSILDAFARGQENRQRQNESQDQARRAIDVLSRRLRNLANPRPPGTSQNPTIDRATPTDLVFRTVNEVGPNTGANTGNVSRVRYCQGTSPSSRLWLQTQTWTTAEPPAVPSVAACPGEGWGSSKVVGENLRNSATSSQRPIFAYGMTDGSAVTTVADAARGNVIAIRPKLFVDAEPDADPGEITTATAIFLRNQNRPPVPSFTASVSGQTVTLNAGASTDPEEQPLKYYWKQGTVDKGQGVVLRITNLTRYQTYSFTLRVEDPDALTGSVTESVYVP